MPGCWQTDAVFTVTISIAVAAVDIAVDPSLCLAGHVPL